MELGEQLLKFGRRLFTRVAGGICMQFECLERNRRLRLRKSRALALLAFLLQQQTTLLALELLDAGAFDTGLTLTLSDRLRVRIPRMLPGRQRVLAVPER